jgi:D-alanyl-D-alanine carboxypeptidase
MLPSGNDAAHCLAEYFGGMLKKEAQDIEEKERKDRDK